ncbi:MAG: SRPBCC domain-containing protein [Halobacteria archaeon]|nr:SRPBCC domain-containing protein [Halobacteria archaeon]
MEFNGEFELEGVTPEEAWLVMSDPVVIKKALPGCKFLTKIESDDFDFDSYEPPEEEPKTWPDIELEEVAERSFKEGETYAALMQVGVGSVKPTFRTKVTISKREFPVMNATGSGESSNSSFELQSGMTVSETENGSKIEWWSETNIMGRIAQMGQRVINPVANKVVNRFFKNIENQILETEEREKSEGIGNRIRNLLG